MVSSTDSCGSLHPPWTGTRPPLTMFFSSTGVNFHYGKVKHLVICPWKDCLLEFMHHLDSTIFLFVFNNVSYFQIFKEITSPDAVRVPWAPEEENQWKVEFLKWSVTKPEQLNCPAVTSPRMTLMRPNAIALTILVMLFACIWAGFFIKQGHYETT